ncbi:MAG: malate dehydrogenase (oxaloacetate-decarboxylating) [Phycisphaerales bacterium]
MKPDYNQLSIDLHKRLGGKIELGLKAPVTNIDELSVAYTPGVAAACEAIAADPELSRTMTIRGNAVAIVTDGSAVLGLGNIGPLAAMPVMEGKAMLFKAFAGIDAWPICLGTQDTREIVETVRRLAPSFGGINLEDISAPRCFHIEEELQDLGIPVFHDDQHGTAIVLLAALINAAKVVGKDLADLRVVISGAGAAGSAIARMLRCVNQDESVCVPVRDVIVCDSRGAIHGHREGLSKEKMGLVAYTNRDRRAGTLHEVLEGADVFVGVSVGGLLTGADVKRMADKPIILAMANPDPEIDPQEAWDAGAAVVGTGRSDYPNQVNNLLAFPGIFRGAIDCGATKITAKMKLAAAYALAEATGEPTAERVLPNPLDKSVVPKVAKAVADAAGN